MNKSENKPPFIATELSEESYQELLPEFFEEIREDFAALLTLFQKKDWSMIRRSAHKIKGTASSYGAVLMVEAASALQKGLDAGHTDQCKVWIDQLNQSIDVSYEYAKANFGITE